MELYCLGSEAADIGGILVEDSGFAPNDYVTKEDLLSAGKFDYRLFEDYNEKDYVLKKHVVKGEFTVSVNIEESSLTRGKIQINDGELLDSASIKMDLNSSVTVKCSITNPDDVFLGWFVDGMKMSSDLTYTFVVENNIELEARIAYMDVSLSSLSFTSSGGTQQITITSNTGFTIS